MEDTQPVGTLAVADVRARLNRVIGQLQAVAVKVGEESSCEEVIPQLQAARKALDSATALVIVSLISECEQLSQAGNDSPYSKSDLTRMLAKIL